MTTFRVAAAQFATGTDVDDNLATATTMLNAAADTGSRIVVLPEFCNHLSVYDDADHAWAVAVDLDGNFVTKVRNVAADRGVWTQLNVTLRRRHGSDTDDGRHLITNSNILIDPAGAIAAVNDKTVLMGAEGEHLSPATHASDLIDTDLGTVGTYACMDGVVPEVPRSVAVRGARLLLNSLNSFARDEASLHIPVRAAENRAWVVACCKVGPLLPADKEQTFAAAMGVPAAMLRGAGESQIVAPDGTVIAKGPADGEAVVHAEIDMDRAGQLRPDGTDLWSSRRPALYAALARPTPPPEDHTRADALDAAVASTLDQVRDAVTTGARLIVMPESDAGSATRVADLAALLAELTDDPDVAVVAASTNGVELEGTVVTGAGVVVRQRPLHDTVRHRGAPLDDRLESVDLPWGRLAVVVGDDLAYPEVARLAALARVDVLAAPIGAQEEWDTSLAPAERAAENRIMTVVATSPGGVGRSVICDLPPDPTLWAPTRVRPFDGTINQPDLTWADHAGFARATLHPQRSTLRQISRGTDLVDGRPWRLCEPLVQE